jgi:hypothetical protein
VKTDTEKITSMKTEVGITMSQAKDHVVPPEPRRDKKRLSPRDFRGNVAPPAS